MSTLRKGESIAMTVVGFLMILASSAWAIGMYSQATNDKLDESTRGLAGAVLLVSGIIWLPLLVGGIVLVVRSGLFRTEAKSAGTPCPSCQRLLRTPDAPCGHCGATQHLSSSCASCHKAVGTLDRFCRHCGATK